MFVYRNAEAGRQCYFPQFDGQCLEYLLAFFERARRACDLYWNGSCVYPVLISLLVTQRTSMATPLQRFDNNDNWRNQRRK